jgi:phosphoribosylformylglycinamidine synthase
MIVTLLEMCFTRPQAGLKINLDGLAEKDLVKILFSENPGIIIQAEDKSGVEAILVKRKIRYHILGHYESTGFVVINKGGVSLSFDVNKYRDIWFKTSYLLDRKQCGELLAKKRFVNYKTQPLDFHFQQGFSGKAAQYHINRQRMGPSGIRSAIIREKGVNGDREMAFMMHLAGFDVKDVHMTDLISGREKLDDVNLIVFVGGFSTSDVLGSAKGWAGAFLYNDEARNTLYRFYARQDTLSLGVCNGCQLMTELDLIVPGHTHKPGMSHNDSHKFESAFLSVYIPRNPSVMLKSLAGSTLGIWVAHGEGHINLPDGEAGYNVSMKYTYPEYPGNPNGSDYAVAGICSDDGRHLAIMPHLERSIFPWNWACYPEDRQHDEVSPWIESFVNARDWITARFVN